MSSHNSFTDILEAGGTSPSYKKLQNFNRTMQKVDDKYNNAEHCLN